MRRIGRLLIAAHALGQRLSINSKRPIQSRNSAAPSSTARTKRTAIQSKCQNSAMSLILPPGHALHQVVDKQEFAFQKAYLFTNLPCVRYPFLQESTLIAKRGAPGLDSRTGEPEKPTSTGFSASPVPSDSPQPLEKAPPIPPAHLQEIKRSRRILFP